MSAILCSNKLNVNNFARYSKLNHRFYLKCSEAHAESNLWFHQSSQT